MIRVFYNVLIFLLAPAWVPWMLLRVRRRNSHPDWRERMGLYDISPSTEERLWVHAVSVGELIAVRPVLRELRKQIGTAKIVVTCTTSSGYALAQNFLGNEADYVFYFPIDVPLFCMRALLRVRPRVVAIMETELWMNFLHSAKLVGAQVFLLNARISDRTFRRARWLKFFYKRCLRYVDHCFAQSKQDAERLRYFGKEEVVVMGNTKYDDVIEPGTIDWRKELQMKEGERLIVVGSTRSEKEEELVLQALKGLKERILFAPRHIERAPFVVQRAQSYGYDAGLRSKGENHKRLVVLDTFGELASAYPFAYLAIIGGGFEPLGGQNIIQPLSAGCPVLCGKHMFNFKQPVEEALAVGALRVVSDAEELRSTIEHWLANPEERQQRGEAGKRLVERNRGSAKRMAMEIVKAWQKSLSGHP